MQVTVELTPLKGTVSTDFAKEVNKLRRPYIPISKRDWEALLDGKADYYQLGDMVVTFGNADGGHALMPLSVSAAAEVLAKQ